MSRRKECRWDSDSWGLARTIAVTRQAMSRRHRGCSRFRARSRSHRSARKNGCHRQCPDGRHTGSDHGFKSHSLDRATAVSNVPACPVRRYEADLLNHPLKMTLRTVGAVTIVKVGHCRTPMLSEQSNSQQACGTGFSCRLGQQQSEHRPYSVPHFQPQ